MFEIEWDANANNHTRRRQPYRHKASTIHGWVTKLRGTLLDNEFVRQQGIREMKDAKRKRQYRKQQARQKTHRGFFSFFIRSKPKESNSRAVVVRKDGSRHHRHRAHKGKPPLMHFPHRTKPSHHGKGTILRGHVTGNKETLQKGKQMQKDAEEQRMRARRRREKRRDREARAIRRG